MAYKRLALPSYEVYPSGRDVMRSIKKIRMEGTGLKEIWMRAGVALQVTDEEAGVLLSEAGEAAQAVVCRVIEEGRFYFDGNSYIPANVVEEFNDKHGTGFALEEPEFELPSIGGFTRSGNEIEMTDGPTLTL